ncbi:MAG: 6,7-dimethyl-8-ribityllumazine synthase [Candidatus Diapherotrites archaeon]|uniref:6,7-dimethyl-8-ribityllumazine synthase n=1 Tax=Candidatus Iainarchaeum sp. TaxID=3101447 RepID=A0A8T3YID7_9ARCH|nr:6,7-dimethyl-8-ribityllumazine synthase [Candidatus Diapherotrites archaeon]
MRIGIVVADFHRQIAREMLLRAQAKARGLGIVEVIAVVKVTGAFDVPLQLKRMLAREDIDGAVVLGAVVQGETSHDEVVAYTVAGSIMRLSLEYNKPVGYGISGPRMGLKQAKARAKEFAERAVVAVARL